MTNAVARLDALLQPAMKALVDRAQWRVDAPASSDSAQDWCSNDYLGLGRSQQLVAAALEAMQTGSGAGASRLVTGTLPIHRQLEARLAQWMGQGGSATALLFNNGFAANTGLLSAVLQPGDAVFSDALNHASIIDGIRLGRAERFIFSHQDFTQLGEQLSGWRGRGRKWIVTESIFSMDGDATDLRALCDLADAHDAFVLVDEAHALGVRGEGGRGLCHELGVANRVVARVGTCGKAMGSYGAFVVCSAALRGWLYNRARPLVFSTALPPAAAGATLQAVSVLEHGEHQRALRARTVRLASALASVGWWRGGTESAIFPLRIGDAAQTMALSAALLQRGYRVTGIRPPTVPEGTSRLRVTMRADVDIDEIDRFVEALVSASAAVGVLPPFSS
ncbi:MAG: 8-amino-7-oxononanoate synthase [Myxococcales bacterium]|nr:8-amino-7-oxononanoate synthase [Myxococcales bacterium]